MQKAVTLFIIAFMSSTATGEDSSGNYEDKETSRGDTPPVVGIWGNPIVGRALVLLLRGSGYETRFLTTSSLREPRSLEDIRLLLLAPTPELSIERRKALLAALQDELNTAEIAVFELVEISEETREERVQGASWQRIPWPSKIEDLKRRVEVTLLSSPS